MEQEDLGREFQRRAAMYSSLEEEVIFILKGILGKTNIKLHSISSRVKTFESFLDKAQRKQTEKPFEEIQDIVGLRVICLFLSDIPRIGDQIRNAFLVLSEDNKLEGTDVSSFGYMSVHFTATMKKEHSGPRYDHIAGVPFEIQVRTIAMEAWANISHYLDYKTEKDVPQDLKRDFFALSGLFYVADKHFEMFYGARTQSQEKMTKLFDEATPKAKTEQEINLDSLTAYLRRRFPDRGHAGPKEVSELVSDLLEAGYKNVGDVERIISDNWEGFTLFETEKHNPNKFTDVGVARIAGRIYNKNFNRVVCFRSLPEETRQSAFTASEKDLERYRSLSKK